MMINFRINNALNRALDNPERFHAEAENIVGRIVKSGMVNIDLEDKESVGAVVDMSAVFMNIGSELGRNKNIGIGVCLGAVGTLGIMRVSKIFNDKKQKQKEVE